MVQLMPRNRSHEEDVLIDDLESFLQLLWAHADFFHWKTPHYFDLEASSTYCQPCGARRRVKITILYAPLHIREDQELDFLKFSQQLVPSLYKLTCLQCKTEFISLIHDSPERHRLAIFSNYGGGIRTPNTPPGVAYYLDQAYRSQAVGSNSAAIAMYRGALEHLLFEQGYTKGMLASKIDKLNTDIQAGSAPAWALELDTEFLDIIKDLGNGAIHPNDGNVTKQAALDNELLIKIEEIFIALLHLAYEITKQKTDVLKNLRIKVGLLKK